MTRKCPIQRYCHFTLVLSIHTRVKVTNIFFILTSLCVYSVRICWRMSSRFSVSFYCRLCFTQLFHYTTLTSHFLFKGTCQIGNRCLLLPYILLLYFKKENGKMYASLFEDAYMLLVSTSPSLMWTTIPIPKLNISSVSGHIVSILFYNFQIMSNTTHFTLLPT